MADTTLPPEPPAPSSGPPAPLRYSDSAVREAYRMLLAEFKDEGMTVKLVARSCRMPESEVRRILTACPAPAAELAPSAPLVAPAPVLRKDMTTRILKAPKPAAMLAFKQFALSDPEVNATVLAAVHVPEGPFGPAGAVLERHGFRVLPGYAQLNESQQAILDYVAAVVEAHPSRLCCGAKNVRVEGAEEKVGRISSPDLPVDEAHFDVLVAPVRKELAGQLPKAVVRYLSLPPLDTRRLVLSPNTVVLDRREAPEAGAQQSVWVDEKFLRARSRDLAFVQWIAKRFPKGAPLEDVLAQIECADWLIALLAYTSCPPDTQAGKRMLVRLACLCAMRAQRWAPNPRARQALAAAERWVENPSEENRALAGQANGELNAPAPPEEKPLPEGPAAYAAQAALESASRAVQAACSTEASRARSHATRAAASAVMAASFAANAAKSTSWLEMVSSRVIPDETEEHRALCIAMRAIVQKSENMYPVS